MIGSGSGHCHLLAYLDNQMAELTFETREVLLTLEQNGNEDDTPAISLTLILSTGPTVYLPNGKTLQDVSWNMLVRELQSGADDVNRQPGSLTYTSGEDKGECLVLINQSAERFDAMVGMFKGGRASEITIVTDGMEARDDYSSRWNTDLAPRLNVLRVAFEFPLPQSEA